MEPARPHPDLSPAARVVLGRARRLGLFLHAKELGLEHMFCALLEDENSAACQALIAGFADPTSLSEEARATADGILVVGSHCSLPFSTLGARALFSARDQAVRAGDSSVSPARLALACLEFSPTDLRDQLARLGLSEQKLQGLLPSEGVPLESKDDESVFRRFGADAKKLLAVAARAAHGAGELSISPQRVLMCALTSTSLGLACTDAASEWQVLTRGLPADTTPATERPLSFEPLLLDYLIQLPADAGSLDMLLGFFSPPQTPVAQLLARQNISRGGLEGARELFRDP